jgi:hypothetical protein
MVLSLWLFVVKMVSVKLVLAMVTTFALLTEPAEMVYILVPTTQDQEVDSEMKFSLQLSGLM